MTSVSLGIELCYAYIYCSISHCSVRIDSHHRFRNTDRSGIRAGGGFPFGKIYRDKGPGIYYLIPLIDRQQKIDTRTATVNLEQQETITKDSVTIKVNAVLWFRIVEASKAILEVVNYQQAVYQFSVTALRNIIGQHSLDEVLKGREQINQTLQSIVDATTEPWGASRSRWSR